MEPKLNGDCGVLFSDIAVRASKILGFKLSKLDVDNEFAERTMWHAK